MKSRRFGPVSRLAVCVFVCGAAVESVAAQGRGQSTTTRGNESSLQSLAGDYQAQTQIVQVRLRGDGILTIAVPPQPLRELEPLGNLRFAQKDLPGYSVEFVRDLNANVVALISHQPNGDFGAARVRAAQDVATKPAGSLPASSQDEEERLLKSLAGDYQAGTIMLAVTLKADGALTLLFPGQPLYHLQPRDGLHYAIQELPGFSVAFDRDSAGFISKMEVFQLPPQRNFTAIRVRGTRTPQSALPVGRAAERPISPAPAVRVPRAGPPAAPAGSPQTPVAMGQQPRSRPAGGQETASEPKKYSSYRYGFAFVFPGPVEESSYRIPEDPYGNVARMFQASADDRMTAAQILVKNYVPSAVSDPNRELREFLGGLVGTNITLTSQTFTTFSGEPAVTFSGYMQDGVKKALLKGIVTLVQRERLYSVTVMQFDGKADRLQPMLDTFELPR